MGFMIFLAVFGLMASTALLGFTVGGFHEIDRETGKKSEGFSAAVTVALLFVAVCCSFIIVDPAVISPLWLQYVTFAAAPAVIGYSARLLLAQKLSNSQA